MGQATVLTEQDNDREVTLAVGQELALSLPENRTTGYRWDIAEADDSLLEVRPVEPSSSSGAVGSGGRAHWIVRAKAAGTARLALKYWRPWEGDRSTRQRFDVHLRISP
jgi:inhibitor of cysteine peptidase